MESTEYEWDLNVCLWDDDNADDDGGDGGGNIFQS